MDYQRLYDGLNIETIEQYIKESLPEKEVTHEHSFKFDLKLFSYGYKRTTKKYKSK